MLLILFTVLKKKMNLIIRTKLILLTVNTIRIVNKKRGLMIKLRMKVVISEKIKFNLLTKRFAISI